MHLENENPRPNAFLCVLVQTEEVLQGLAYRMANLMGFCAGCHRFYGRGCPWFEGAIKAELGRLRYSHTNSGMSQTPRAVGYHQSLMESLPGADLGRKLLEFFIAPEPMVGVAKKNAVSCLFEGIAIDVKRRCLPPAEINKRRMRRSRLERGEPRRRGFSLRVGQGVLPKQCAWFVESANGLRAYLRSFSLELDAAHGAVRFKVRRVCKASASFNPWFLQTARLVDVL